MNKYIPKKLEGFQEYKPNTQQVEILLDANESPWLPEEKTMREIEAALQTLKINRYPDPTAKEAVAAFGKVFSLQEKNIVAGNGSDELISILLSSFLSPADKLLVVTPDFSMYEFYASLYGVEVISYTKDAYFEIDFDEIAKVVMEEKINMVMFSNPCNPSGVLAEKEAALAFVDRVDALVVVDEAYIEFASVDASVLQEAAARENLIVLKTLSKAFGVAGIRLGFAVSNAEIIKALCKVKSPFNVNMVTQAIGRIVLENGRIVKERVAYLQKERDNMQAWLEGQAEKYGFTPYKSETNFILIHMGEKAAAVYEALLKRSIRIRFMPPYIRVTIGTAEENMALRKALNEIFEMEYQGL